MTSERTLLWIDDTPPPNMKDKETIHLTPLTGATPSAFVDLSMFAEVVVVSRNGTRRDAEEVRDAFAAAVPADVAVRLKVSARPSLDAEFSKEDDFSLARDFLKANAEGIRYVVDVGRWITWSSVVWRGLYDAKSENKPRAMLQRELAARGRTQAQEIVRRAKLATDADEVSIGKARLLAKKVEADYRSTKRLNAVWSSVEVMAADSEVTTVHQDDLNRDPGLLNCQSGLIDLRTGELRPHDPAELCTAVSPCSYVEPEWAVDGEGVARRVLPPAPTFEAYLSEAQPDPEIRAYLMRRMGLCAYGAQRTHVFCIDLGNDGRNGKGRLAEILSHCLGDYAITSRSELLLVNRGERHLTQVASLVHRRFAWFDETRAARSLDGAQVKSMTGGSPQRANFMRKDEFSFVPAFTTLLTTNVMPKFEGSDRALGTRLQITPWEVSFAGREDEDLLDKLKAEGEGILARIVMGAVDYLSGSGLRPPSAVRETTDEERGEHDPIGKWLTEHLHVAGAGDRVYTDWLLERYEEHLRATTVGWTETAAHPFAMRLSSWLGEQGWDVKKIQLNAGGKRWRGWEGIGFR